MWNSIEQIAAQRGETVDQAAASLGVSLKQLRRVATGSSFGSKAFWRRMVEWSGGKITPNDVLPLGKERAS